MSDAKSSEIQRQMVLYFLKLGSTGFGGPVALANYMHRDLVENRKWITQEEYNEGLTLAQLAPGPMATQLAIYIGWARGGIPGATLCALAFVGPAFLLCVLLALAYIRFGELQWLQYLFYTVGAAVIGIIVFSAYKLLKKNVGSDRLLFVVWFLSALVTAYTQTEYVILFLLAGVVNLFAKEKSTNYAIFPLWMTEGIAGFATEDTLLKMLLYFTKAGAFVFGSGLAIVPFLYSGVVQDFKWLTERQFVDAVAVAMITPGPVVITVAFIGFLVAGISGAVVASIGTFLPCYLFTIIPAPYFSRFAKNQKIKAFVDGVTAGAIGAIGGACFVLGKRSVVDLPTLIIAVAALIAVAKFKISEPIVILIAAAAGLGHYFIRFGF